MSSKTETQLLNRSVLISGAGSAGQSVGYWLRRYGFEPTVVERSPGPRKGGFAIDLRGAAVEVADRMGILEACRKAAVNMREIRRYNAEGEVIWQTDGNFGAGEGVAGDVEVLRDDLTDMLQESACEGVEYIFGDSITSITQDDDGVNVTFAHGAPRRFDLVIGADGLHSKVRELTFGPADQFKRPLGLYAGIFTIPNTLKLDRQWLMRQMPGKMISNIDYGPGKHTRGLLVFSSPPLDFDRSDLEAQKAILAQAFAGDTSWGVQTLLDGLRISTDLYFDEVTQIHMPRWSNGRVVLIGDAGYAPTLLTGQGTSLAVVGAYVLAGELKAAGGDFQIAFARYEEEARPYAEQNQRILTDCPEMSVPATKEEVDRREDRFRLLQDDPNAVEDDDSAGVFIQSAANAIQLKDYEKE